MVRSKELSLNSLISSQKGLHLTSYLQNRGNFEDLKEQLKFSVLNANLTLKDAMNKEDRIAFLSPLQKLVEEPQLLKGFKGNIGLFRTKDAFRILSIPTQVDNITVVASSFHVKPLLRWLQTDREFLLLGMEEESISLYWGSSSHFNLIDSLVIPSTNHNKNVDEALEWLNEWIYEVTGKKALPLFIAGKTPMTAPLQKKIRYQKLRKRLVKEEFNKENMSEIASTVRTILYRETKLALDSALREFKWAENLKLGKKNIFQVARAVVQGRVKKLIVSDSIQIFGKLDKKTGGISIHPFHLNHEDDDLLDDLAQTVLEQGGKVIIASKDQIPRGRPVLAILKNDPKNSATVGLDATMPEAQALA